MIADHHCAHLYPHAILATPEQLAYASASVDELDSMLSSGDFSENINKWLGACVNPVLTSSQIKTMLDILIDYTLENPSIHIGSNIFKIVKFELIAHPNLPEDYVQIFLERGPGNYIHGWVEMTELDNPITLNPALTEDDIRFFFKKHVSPRSARYYGTPTLYTFGVLFMHLSHMSDSLFSEVFFKLHSEISDAMKCGLLHQAMRAEYVPVDVCSHGIYWLLNLIQTRKNSEIQPLEMTTIHLILDRRENSHSSSTLRQMVLQSTGNLDFAPKVAVDLFVF